MRLCIHTTLTLKVRLKRSDIMVETNICREVKLHCNNCQAELSISDQEHYGEEVCKVCECGFSDNDEIECIEYESDSEGHAHKKCWHEELKKDKATAPIPPTAKAVGILGVIL